MLENQGFMFAADAKSLVKFIDALADAAAEAIMPHFRASTTVSNKAAADFDPVTEGDRAAEGILPGRPQ